MTQKAYDDGDDRWDVQFRCDGCGAEGWDVWDDNPVAWAYQVGECGGPDYCPKCAAVRGLEPGRILA